MIAILGFDNILRLTSFNDIMDFATMIIQSFLFVINACLAREAVFHFNYKCMIWTLRVV